AGLVSGASLTVSWRTVCVSSIASWRRICAMPGSARTRCDRSWAGRRACEPAHSMGETPPGGANPLPVGSCQVRAAHMMGMSTFTESLHPRGKAGKFTTKAKAGACVALEPGDDLESDGPALTGWLESLAGGDRRLANILLDSE